MSCPSCGGPSEPNTHFCFFCGSSLRASAPPAGVTAQGAAAAPALLAPSAPPLPDYSPFVWRFLAGAVACAAAGSSVMANIARSEQPVSLDTVGAVALAALFLLAAAAAWRKLQAEPSPESALHLRKLATRSAFFLVAFCAIGLAVGYAVGSSGRDTTRFSEDYDRMLVIGEHISEARGNSEPTVAGQLRMYNSIASELEAFHALATRLREGAPDYLAKFSQDENSASLRRNIETAHRRATLLQQQATVAKQLEPLDRAAQWEEWQRKMQPLLDEEDRLDAK